MASAEAAAEPPCKKSKGAPLPAKFCAVFMGSSDGADPAYREAASRFGSLLGERGIGLVYGGAKGGLMGAVADGVLQHANGYVVGVIPPGDVVPAEKRHPGLSETVFTQSLGERKEVMLKRADAVVALPGGPGTLDELCEVVTKRRLGQHKKPIFVLSVNEFWEPFIDLLRNMEKAGFAPEDTSATVINIMDTPEELVQSGRFVAATAKPSFIDKLALIKVHDRKQLVARSKGKTAFFTPGGKREAGESDEEALLREIKEELNVDLVRSSIKMYGIFQAQAFGKPEGTMVRMTCYEAAYEGVPSPTNEIEELRWISSKDMEQDKGLLSITGEMIVNDLKAKDLID